MKSFKDVLNAGANLAEKAVKGAETLVDKGKKQISKTSLEAQQAALQKKLGALVYSMAKSGKSSGEAVQKYISQLDVIESQLELFKKENKVKNNTIVCGECGAQQCDGAMFCCECGQKLV